MVFGYTVMLGAAYGYTQHWPDRLYFLGSFLGSFVWFNMLSTRIPRVLGLLFKKFDFVFMTINFFVMCLSLCQQFDWDGRAFVYFFTILPTGLLTLTVESSASDVEVNMRKCTFLFVFLYTCYMLIAAQSGMIVDTTDLTLYFHSATWTITTSHNATASVENAQGGAWDVVNAYNVLDVGVSRGLYFIVFAGSIFVKSFTRPDECSWLTSNARRTIIGGASEEPDASLRAQQLERADTGNMSPSTSSPNALLLDEQSKKELGELRDDAKVFVFAPVNEFALTSGIGDTVLCQLFISNTDSAKVFQEKFDKLKYTAATVFVPLGIIGFLGLTRAIPEVFTWCFSLNLYYWLRMTLKFNYFAIKMCMAQVFTFWVPVLMACAATGVGLHSFEEDFAAQMFVVTMTLNFISSSMLSNDCDLRRKRLENGTGTGTGLILSLVAYLVWTFFFVMGGFPSAKNHTYSFIIGNRTVVLGSMSLLSRFMSTPILYMGVSAYYNCVHKGKCSVIKIPLARKRMPKAEVAGFLKRYHKKREDAFSTVIDASMRGRRKNSNMIHSLDTLQIEDASQALRDEDREQFPSNYSEGEEESGLTPPVPHDTTPRLGLGRAFRVTPNGRANAQVDGGGLELQDVSGTRASNGYAGRSHLTLDVDPDEDSPVPPLPGGARTKRNGGLGGPSFSKKDKNPFAQFPRSDGADEVSVMPSISDGDFDEENDLSGRSGGSSGSGSGRTTEAVILGGEVPRRNGSYEEATEHSSESGSGSSGQTSGAVCNGGVKGQKKPQDRPLHMHPLPTQTEFLTLSVPNLGTSSPSARAGSEAGSIRRQDGSLLSQGAGTIRRQDASHLTLSAPSLSTPSPPAWAGSEAGSIRRQGSIRSPRRVRSPPSGPGAISSIGRQNSNKSPPRVRAPPNAAPPAVRPGQVLRRQDSIAVPSRAMFKKARSLGPVLGARAVSHGGSLPKWPH
mmetsp:Transcript_10951/g.29350  ORF Transcript_10951/g.29350 Transcript_10951/m.29350 type:complete len:957 (+) Transcript_10951:122-2992(+)